MPALMLTLLLLAGLATLFTGLCLLIIRRRHRAGAWFNIVLGLTVLLAVACIANNPQNPSHPTHGGAYEQLVQAATTP